ncbi:MAG: LuxR C-terminal-related transcriptional regulator [Kofleriaceae bacterium]
MSKSTQGTEAAALRAWTLEVGGETFAVVSAPARGHGLATTLTAAERDVVAGLVRGESTRTIARRRGTSERTVANQLAALYAKLGVMSRAELLVYLRDRGMAGCSSTK